MSAVQSGYEYDDDEADAAYAAHLAEPAESHRVVVRADLRAVEPVLRAIEEMGYRHPTPIQEQVRSRSF